MNNTDLADRIGALFALEARHLADTVRGDVAAQFSNSLKVTGARPLQLGRAAEPTNAGTILSNGPGRLLGWSLRATDTDVTLTFHDARSPDGDVLAVETITAGTTATRTLAAAVGVSYGEGLYLERSGGTLTGAVWVRPGD